VSQKMRLQIAGLEQAQKNAKSGISYVQTAEGALQEVHDMLERMYTLAEQSANGTFDDSTDRTQLQKEVNNLMEEINRIGKTANFNGMGIFTQYEGGTGSSLDIKSTAGTAAGTGSFKDGTKATNQPITVTGQIDGAAVGTALDLTGTTAADMSSYKGGTLTIKAGDAQVTVKVGTDADSDINLGTGWGTADGKAPSDLAAAIIQKAKDKFATANSDGAKGTTTYDKIEDIALTAGNDGKVSGTASTTTRTYDAGDAGTASTLVVDFTGKTGKDVIGTTLTVGDKTYEFVKTGENTKTTGAVKVEVAEEAAAADIATALGGAAAPTGTTAAAATTKVTFTNDDVGADEIQHKTGKAGGEGGISFWVGAENLGTNKLTLKSMSLEVGNISVEDPDFTDGETPGVNLTNKVTPGDISEVDITDATSAMEALDDIKAASDSVSNMRGTLGAMQNRLNHTINNLSVMQENMQDAESVIRDTDVAEEMMDYTKNSILVQSAQAMLAQANQLPQGVLQLLQ